MHAIMYVYIFISAYVLCMRCQSKMYFLSLVVIKKCLTVLLEYKEKMWNYRKENYLYFLLRSKTIKTVCFVILT